MASSSKYDMKDLAIRCELADPQAHARRRMIIGELVESCRRPIEIPSNAELVEQSMRLRAWHLAYNPEPGPKGARLSEAALEAYNRITKQLAARGRV